MKKIIISLIALVAIFTLSSCAKSCNCKVVLDGTVIEDYEVELEEGERCSDFEVNVGMAKTTCGAASIL